MTGVFPKISIDQFAHLKGCLQPVDSYFQDKLSSLLKTAENLKVKGLAEVIMVIIIISIIINITDHHDDHDHSDRRYSQMPLSSR